MTTGARDARQILADTRALIDPVYRSALARLPAAVRHPLGYHVGWWDVDGNPTAATGKAFAPAMVLLCARAAGGAEPAIRSAALPAAVAVEMIHDASLIHDDIIDDDRTRRHRPATWHAFGTGIALCAATTLFPLANELLRSRADIAELDRAVRDTYEGQVDDSVFEGRDAVSVQEYLGMAAKKTASLLGTACVLGANAGGADATAAGHYREFGRAVGLAYQINDDLLGIWGRPETTGKPVHSDLVTRKKTAPVVAAMTSGTDAGEALKRLYTGEKPADQGTTALMASLIERAGARSWATEEADRWSRRARTALRLAGPGEVDDLITLVEAAVARRS